MSSYLPLYVICRTLLHLRFPIKRYKQQCIQFTVYLVYSLPIETLKFEEKRKRKLLCQPKRFHTFSRTPQIRGGKWLIISPNLWNFNVLHHNHGDPDELFLTTDFETWWKQSCEDDGHLVNRLLGSRATGNSSSAASPQYEQQWNKVQFRVCLMGGCCTLHV